MAILTRAQRWFAAWLEQAPAEVRAELRPGRRTRKGWAFDFASSPALRGYLSYDIDVGVHLEDECWDSLLWVDLPARRRPGDLFICPACEDPPGAAYPSERDLWFHHLDVLGRWITERLHTARAQAFYQTRSGGSTWAKLIAPPPNRRLEVDAQPVQGVLLNQPVAI